MEITHPDAVDDGIWYATNGLLVVEFMTGELQDRVPADRGVLGDGASGPHAA
jgi:hypothetical protein